MPDLPEWILQHVPPAVIFIAGVVMLLAGGHGLVEGAIRIARRLEVSPLVIGLTVVAFGTSAPELAFNVIAASSGQTALSFGNVVGSNIANIGLVLGLAAILRPFPVSRAVARTELPLLLLVTIAATLLAFLPIAHAPLPGEEDLRYGYGRIEGPILLMLFLGFCAMWIRTAMRDRETGPPMVEPAVEQSGPGPSLLIAIILTLGGLCVLLIGGKATEIGAVGLAEAMGLSATFIGLSIVAISTSLPEIVTTVIAARRGQSEMAIGNVIGSNLFNLMLVLGTTSLIVPVPVPTGGMMDLAVMLVLTALLVPMGFTRLKHGTRSAFSRTEGMVLLLLYALYLGARLAADG